MPTPSQTLQTDQENKRQQYIIQTFLSAFSNMIEKGPAAWRSKFRKMSSTPFSFYRGSAALFFSDMKKLILLK